MIKSARDETSTIAGLRQLAIDFRDQRNWKQFHDLKNLAMGLSIEAAELQELFLWKSREEVDEMLATEEGRGLLMDEMADIMIFLLYLSDGARIDLSTAVREKIEKNGKKYPVDKSYGSSRKYTEL
jgi:NTP pyrophosphatase (non-canonical NTP hydrolase)